MFLNISNIKEEALAALGDAVANKIIARLSDPSHYQDFLNRLYQIDRLKVNYIYCCSHVLTN